VSSGIGDFFITVRPGSVLVVVAVVGEAAVEDAHESVGE
jgi:hypothetical protein